MKLRSKILLPFSIVILLFIIFFAAFSIISHRELVVLKIDRAKEQQATLDYIIDIKSDISKSIVQSYIGSNEFYRILKQQNVKQAANKHKANSQYSSVQDTIDRYHKNLINSNNFYAIWIFDGGKHLIYSLYKDNIQYKINFPAEEIEGLEKQNNNNFFILTDAGLIEIAGSPVQILENRKYTSTIAGYLLIGKLWDDKYINNLEHILDASIYILKPNSSNFKSKDQTVISASRILTDRNGKPTAKIVENKISPFLTSISNRNYFISYFFLLFIISLLVIIILSFRWYIDNPLTVIENSLISEDISGLHKIIHKNDEFGKISGMIDDFFEQRRQLYDEIHDKDIAEIELKKSESKYRDLLDNIAHGVFRSTLNGKFTQVNEAFVKLLGYSTADEMLSLNIVKDVYQYPEQKKKILNALNTEGIIVNFELNIKCKNGKILYCLLNARTIKDSEGNILFYEGSLTDISDYKNLKSLFNKLELAINQSDEGVAFLNNDRIIEYGNDAFAKIHGFTLNEIIGKNINKLHSPNELYTKDIQELLDKIESDGYFYGEVPHMRKDGTMFSLLLSVTIVKDLNNKRIGTVGIYKDISEQKKIENEIRRLNKELEEKVFEQNKYLNDTNNKLKLIIEKLEEKERDIEKSRELYITTINSSTDWIHFINRNYEFVLANDAYIRINNELGLETDVIGKNIKEIYYFLPNNLTDEYDYVFETGKELVSEENTTLGGKNYILETIKTPVFENNKVNGVITIIRDITERKALENKVLTAVLDAEEKEKKRFSEDLHDGLGALLSTMKIYVNSILKKKTIDESYDLLIQLKDMIYEAVENTRGIAFNMTPNVLVDFGLIRAVKSYCDKLNTTQDINVSFNSSDHYERFSHIIEINFFRIIQELINNSLKHSGAKNINISIQFKKKGLNLLYSDDGKGMENDKNINKNVKGIGMNNIFARVKLLNGVCKIESDKGKGIHVDIEVNNIINI